MQRNDLIGSTRAPQSIIDLVTRIGGKNVYSEPNYRFVLSQDRVCQQAAEWHDWDTNLTIQERGGMVQDDDGNFVGSSHKPNRVVIEMRTIPRYPLCTCPEGVLRVERNAAQQVTRSWYEEAGDCEACHGVRGWIIERWWPAHVIGDKEAWEKDRINGMPRRGPFPETGAYRRVAMSKATAQIPSIKQIEQLIHYLEFIHQDRTANPEQLALEMANSREAAIQKAKDAEDQLNREKIREALDPLTGSSLAAGRAREFYANRLRSRGVPVGHVGS